MGRGTDHRSRTRQDNQVVKQFGLGAGDLTPWTKMRGLQARSDLWPDHRETATQKFGYVIKTKHWCCNNSDNRVNKVPDRNWKFSEWVPTNFLGFEVRTFILIISVINVINLWQFTFILFLVHLVVRHILLLFDSLDIFLIPSQRIIIILLKLSYVIQYYLMNYK